MEQVDKQDLLEIFDEAEELELDFKQFTDEEIIKCKYAMQARCKKIMELASQYITDKEMENYLTITN